MIFCQRREQTNKKGNAVKEAPRKNINYLLFFFLHIYAAYRDEQNLSVNIYTIYCSIIVQLYFHYLKVVLYNFKVSQKQLLDLVRFYTHTRFHFPR